MAGLRSLYSQRAGTRLILMGNHAIARGAMEAGVGVAAAYPGTPASEIGDALAPDAERGDYYFEYSPNEKVAMEIAGAASACGVRAITFMKHVGLNVAADAFMSLAYVGVKGGMVVVTSDDPSLHSSQNEQDNRYYARIANVPMLEPSDPESAKDMTIAAFALSEELEIPVLLRSTTRVSHIRGIVTCGKKQKSKAKGQFEKAPSRYVPVPANAKKLHKVLLEKMKKAQTISERSPFQFTKKFGERKPELGIITSGPSYNYIHDLAKEFDLPVEILKLGMTHPLPEKLITKFLKKHKKVLILEELEPYLEESIRSIAQKNEIKTKILGKHDGLLPCYWEFNPGIVGKAVFPLVGRKFPKPVISGDDLPPLPTRPPVLCPACPHRGTYYALREALRKLKIKHVVFPTDIGCYTLGIQPPYLAADYLLCMGSSFGTAVGFGKAQDAPVIAFIGDSTFFHAGLPALAGSVHHSHSYIAVIMDNSTTAMTGHQPHPGLERNGMGRPAYPVSIEKIAKAMGIDLVQVVDPYDLQKTTDAFIRALQHKKLSVLITQRECALIARKPKIYYRINEDRCTGCKVCITRL
ncbi:MAG: indolepyruvate ferredoxin oxidoreductase subunit alpha, partial [Candidatus Eremiobacteraeota bacterium]|nr:indolepyruvate ferredoxin oxidoreductase subunit alpha [Candidatus Eremiobacteraeota bacterium]